MIKKVLLTVPRPQSIGVLVSVYKKMVLINYYIIVLDMMKTAIIIQIEQLGQYGLFSRIGRL
jgi:hypothetical protein